MIWLNLPIELHLSRENWIISREFVQQFLILTLVTGQVILPDEGDLPKRVGTSLLVHGLRTGLPCRVSLSH
jgi:hypothetical protein